MSENVTDSSPVQTVRAAFIDLQEQICSAFEAFDGEASFLVENIDSQGGGLSRPRVLADGKHLEKAAVQFTHSVGPTLPPAATERNPHLAGLPFEAVAISLITHPRNPFVPTSHMNLRFFAVHSDPLTWYFGGGYDLTPVYGFVDDCVHWHRTAANAAGDHYPAWKAACDDYFHLGHRNECRGVGGVFFDDFVIPDEAGGFNAAFEQVIAVGRSYLPAYLPIIERRRDQAFDASHRAFQLYRRGRYAEFNLAIDRGTKYGLQSGRRIESVLASLPPLAAWEYNRSDPPDSAEAALARDFLPPRDWLSEASE